MSQPITNIIDWPLNPLEKGHRTAANAKTELAAVLLAIAQCEDRLKELRALQAEVIMRLISPSIPTGQGAIPPGAGVGEAGFVQASAQFSNPVPDGPRDQAQFSDRHK